MSELENLKKKKRINSRDKGKRGERAWRDQLREAGFLKSYRGQQYCGTEGNADVVCPELPTLHFEVKYTEKFNAYDALWQSVRDCGTKTPIVAHKRNNCDWLVVMRAVDWFGMIKDAGYAKTIFCPDCKTTDVIKMGYTEKLNQRYRCLNNACQRQTFICPARVGYQNPV